MPRRITDYLHYKASEFYNFILFYSLPTLINYLPDKYFQHWLLFVIALFNLLKKKITIQDIEEAEKLFKLYVKQIEELYSDRELSYNVHQLLHLALSVRRWGPLWATSAFPFENFNGFLANCVHGNKHLGQELVNNLVIAQGIQILNDRVSKHNIIVCKTKNYELLSMVSNVYLNDVEHQLLISEDLNIQDVCFYARAKINNEIYTSKAYKITKTNNFTVQINIKSQSIIYGSIQFFFER